jgi:metal-responsive CopG/Arc/MetJ family transcriptional regulator
MSRATLTLPNDLLDELMKSVSAKSKTEAVILAIRDEIKSKKIRKIKEMAGSMEFSAAADVLRHGDRRIG